MVEEQLLNKLHDIQLPKPVGWWPLAPGWYALIIALLIFLAMMCYLYYRRFINAKAKREALQRLADYQQCYLKNRNSQLYSIKISELLRRVALVYFPREKVAGLQGQEWIKFLNENAKGLNFNEISSFLLELPYQPPRTENLQPLFSHARAWIKQRGKPCSN
jgi:hypothetical protein